jgi:hypothetical protein
MGEQKLVSLKSVKETYDGGHETSGEIPTA